MGIAEGCELKRATAAQVISTLASIGTEETKKNGKFVIPGLVMIKTREKPATKAAKREMFGKTVLVKARPARTVVKAFPAKVLKNEFRKAFLCAAEARRAGWTSAWSRTACPAERIDE